MKHLYLFLCGLALIGAIPAYGQFGLVRFSTDSLDSSPQIYDVDGSPLAGTNFWAQLYSADGLSATEDQLQGAGVPVNFQTGLYAGYVQDSGINALGQAFNGVVRVASVQKGPASVQIRAWSGPFATYESATNGGAHFGASRILRIPETSGDSPPPPFVPPSLTDSNGDVNSFSLHLGVPALFINDVIVVEGATGTVSAVFTVNLSIPLTQSVSVSYATADGSAVAGTDYAATSGALVFPPGQSNETITVTVTANSPSNADKNFFVNLSNPVEVAIGRAQGTCAITDLRVTGISFNTSVSFHTILGHTYDVERSGDLINWTLVPGATNIAGVGGTVTITDYGAGCASKYYYRAQLIQ